MERNALVCYNCGVRLEAVKIGATIRPVGYSGYFKADLYECPICETRVFSGFSREWLDDGEIEYDYEDVIIL